MAEAGAKTLSTGIEFNILCAIVKRRFTEISLIIS